MSFSNNPNIYDLHLLHFIDANTTRLDDRLEQGLSNVASGSNSHAEGNLSTALGDSAHAEGQGAIALGLGSHAEGYQTTAKGQYSHTSGRHNIAGADHQTVVGKNNIELVDDGAFIIGDGTDTGNRHNLLAAYNGELVISASSGFDGPVNIAGGALAVNSPVSFTGSLGVSGPVAVNGPSAFTGSVGVIGDVKVTGSISATAGFTGSFTGSHFGYHEGQASLSGSFSGSHFGQAILTGSFLGQANLTGSYLGQANLTGSFLGVHSGSANLNGIFVGEFTGSANLSGSFTGSLNGQFTGSADLPDLVDGVGIVDFMYDGSAPATIAISGASTLNVNGITKWTGNAFANSSLTDDGVVVSGASSIQLSGTGSKLTGSFTGDHHGQFTGSFNGCADCARNGITTGSGLSDIQTINGSLTVTNNLQVLGSASITYVTSSQVLINSASIGVFADSATFQTASYFAFDISNPANNASLFYNANAQLWSFDKPLSASLNKSISNGAGIDVFSYNGSGNASVAIANLGVSNAMLAGGITEDKLFGAIPNAKLANSTISGVALGSNLFDLSVDNSSIEFSAGGPYNGGAAAGIRVKALGITDAMLAGAISNAKLANSAITINGVSTALGGSYTMANLTAGAGITLANYNGSTTQAISIANDAITNAMILNDSITINGNTVALGGSTVVTANLANALNVSTPNLTIGAPFDGSAAQTIALSNTLTGLTSLSSTGFTGALTGNASTATTLQTPRNINGVAFDGSANITITANTPNALTNGLGIAALSYNGSAGATVALASDSITINGTAVALGGTRNVSLQEVCNVGFTTTTNINANAFFQTSKREKKKDIIPFEKSALEIIGKTSIVEFKYKDDETNKVHIGFIADDTPVELSTVNQDVMDTNSAIGVLLKAVQELEAKIKQLEAK
jgi:hypothetical protein